MSSTILDGSQSGYESDSENEEMIDSSRAEQQSDARRLAADGQRDDDASSHATSSSAESHELHLATLRAAVLEAPASFDAHLQLVTALRATDLHTELREAREKMSARFPLPASLWKEWLVDELTRGAASDADCTETDETAAYDAAQGDPVVEQRVSALYDRAVLDYLSGELWLGRAQFRLLQLRHGRATLESVRAAFEEAVTAVGMHPLQGDAVWQAYRQMEQHQHALLLDAVDDAADAGDTDAERSARAQADAQQQVVRSLFRRQLVIPSPLLLTVLASFLAWEREQQREAANQQGDGDGDGDGEEVDVEQSDAYKTTLRRCEGAQKHWERCASFEQQLSTTFDYHSPPYHEQTVWEAYIDAEREHKVAPTRLTLLYERALERLFLVPALWEQYLCFLSKTFKSVPELSERAAERAVRNVSWSGRLWSWRLLTQQRAGHSLHSLAASLAHALAGQLSDPLEYAELFSSYLGVLRRLPLEEEDDDREEDDQDEEAAAQTASASHVVQQQTALTVRGELRSTIERALQLLDYMQAFPQWASAVSAARQQVLSMAAELYAHHLGDVNRARRVYARLLKGNAATAEAWLSHVRFELQHGSEAAARSLFKRALLMVMDWPESVFVAWLQFERARGSTADLVEAHRRVTEHRALVQRRLAKEQQRKEQAGGKKAARRGATSGKHSAKGGATHASQQRGHRKHAGGTLTAAHSAESEQDVNTSSVLASKRKRSTCSTDEMSSSTAMSEANRTDIMDEDAAPDAKATCSSPDVASKKARISETTPDPVVVENAIEVFTVTVRNLDPLITQADLEERFAHESLKSVRLVLDEEGISKGFAFLDFTSEEGCKMALKQHRQRMAGKTIQVVLTASASSVGAPSATQDEERGVKYHDDSNTLFVRNLGFVTTQQDLLKFFSSCGDLLEVRLVRDGRTGRSKGFAYVEFSSAEGLNNALKLDQHVLNHRKISVAKSRPKKRTPGGSSSRNDGGEWNWMKPKFKPTSRPSSVTRLSDQALERLPAQRLSMTPRAMLVGSKRPASNSSTTDKVPGGSGQKSNADFRAYLLGKK